MKNNWMKKRIITLLFAVATLLVAGESYAAIKKSKVVITAKIKSEKDKDSREEEIKTFDSIKNISSKIKTESCTLTLKLENREDHPVAGEIKWCFISDYSSGKVIDHSPEKSVPAIFSPGQKMITLAAGAVHNETIISELFEYEERREETERLNTDRESSSEKDIEIGNVYKGYLVLFVVDGKVVAKKSNSTRYVKDKWIEQCLNPPGKRK